MLKLTFFVVVMALLGSPAFAKKQNIMDSKIISLGLQEDQNRSIRQLVVANCYSDTMRQAADGYDVIPTAQEVARFTATLSKLAPELSEENLISTTLLAFSQGVCR